MARRASRVALALALGFGASACGDDGGSASTSGVSLGDAPDPTTTTPVDTTSEPATTASPATDSGGPADSTSGGGTACTSSAECAGDEYCRWIDDSCGVSGLSGQCTPRSDCDNGNGRPVCGCDGAVHDTRCAAQDAGIDVDFLGGCETPAGAFDCGFSFCINGDEYCQQLGGNDPSAECIVLPPVCQPPDCSCVTTCCGCDNASCCSDFCTNEGGALTYTCPGD